MEQKAGQRNQLKGEPMKLMKSFIFLLVVITLFRVHSFGQSVSEKEDDDLYNEIVTIRGKVKAMQSESENASIRIGAYLIFQRTDCKKCLIATTTDENGGYEIKVSKGKYRLIVRGGTQEGKMFDVLSANQSRYLEVKVPQDKQVIEFDILLRYPVNSLHRVIEP